jgi:plastocyanin
VGEGTRLLAILTVAELITPALASETIRVTIDKLKFDPPQVSAHVGDTIEWASGDFVAHTATARNKDWDVAIPAKGVGHVMLKHPGDVDYFCRFHPNMTGRISVTP